MCKIPCLKINAQINFQLILKCVFLLNYMRKMFKKINKEYLLLALILIFGFFLRVYKLGVPALWIDECISTLASLSILENGLPILDSGL